ncbi:hypothetical protein [Streptomyces sp. NPDC058307]
MHRASRLWLAGGPYVERVPETALRRYSVGGHRRRGVMSRRWTPPGRSRW